MLRKFCKIYTKSLSVTSVCLHGDYEHLSPKDPSEAVSIVAINRDGSRQEIKGKVGDNLLFLSRARGIELEGACEGALACSTCHVYIKDSYLKRLPQPVEDEEDMLDLAVFVRSNSRLGNLYTTIYSIGCQITLNKDLEGLEFELPRATRNMYFEGQVPTGH